MDTSQRLEEQEARLQRLLVDGLRGGAPAYRSFLDELSAHLRAYFRRRLAQWPAEVEDLVQETLVAVHTRRHTYDPGRPLTAWVHAIARYKLVDWLRHRASRDAVTVPLDDDDLFTSADADAADACRDVGKLLARLPDRQRLSIVHTRLHGHSVADTARMTGLSESAVKVNVHRGLKALAAHVRRRR
jgi:RNA polymerase sigma-70 factor (ECF subfamily)